MLRHYSHRIFTALFILFGLWLGAKYLLPLTAPFLLAALLALVSEPLVRSMQQHLKVRRGLASGIGVTVVLALTVLLLLALCALLVRQLGALTGVLPDLESATVSGLNALERWLLGLAQRSPQGLRPILMQGVTGIFSSSNALLDGLTERLLNMAAGLLKALPDSALGLGTWVLASFMLSVRLPRIRSYLQKKFPGAWKERYAPHLRTLKRTVCGWLLAQAKLVGITFCILSAGFLLLRVEHTFLWAGITCLVDILPVLGTGTVLIPWSLVCFLQGQTLRAVGLLAIYAVISLLRSVLEPRFVGKQLGLDPLITLIAIYVGYRLWGLPGMLVMPVFAVVAVQFLVQTKKTS